MVILMDYPDAKDWYVAEISQVLHDRFTVNGYITKAIPLQGYKQASRKDRIKALKGVAFGHGVRIRAKVKRPTYHPLIRKERVLMEMEAPCG